MLAAGRRTFWVINMVWIPLLVCGAVLLAVGFRGRRVGQGRSCAGCGYDLAGGEWACCPECGADLSGEGAVRVGRWVRRPRMVRVGGVLCVLAAPGLALAVVAAVSGNPYWWQPNWMLRTSGPGLTSGRAFVDEFQRRLDGGMIGEYERSKFAARAELEVQAVSDPRELNSTQIAWVNVLGDLWRVGEISDDKACHVFPPAVMIGPTVSGLRVDGFAYYFGPFNIMRRGTRVGGHAWYADGARVVGLPNDFHLCSGDGVGFGWRIPADPSVSLALAVHMHGPKEDWDKVWVMWIAPSEEDPGQPRHVRHEIMDATEFEERMRQIAAGVGLEVVERGVLLDADFWTP